MYLGRRFLSFMKRSLLFSVALLLLGMGVAQAQWSTDPAHPLAVADSAVASGDPKLVSDGSTGFYVFWLDSRRGQNKALYGQHLSATGQRLWAAGGKKIVGGSKLWSFDAMRHSSGDVIVSYSLGPSPDTIATSKVTPTGTVAWTTLVGGRGAGSIIYADHPKMIAHPTGVYVAFDVTYIGGSGGYRYHSIDLAGNRKFGKFNGQAIPGDFGGPFYLLPGPRNGGLMIWRNGNGAGTHASARRFNADSTLVGTTNVDIVAGTTGLRYDLNPISDGRGGALVTYVGGNPQGYTTIMTTHLDTTLRQRYVGGQAAVCSNATTNADRPWSMLKNNKLYIAWADNRPPAANFDIYMQAVDTATGASQWTANGVKVTGLGSYIPYPRIVPADSGGFYVTSQVGPGHWLQRVQTSGQPQFSGFLLTDQNHQPFYENYLLAETGAAPIIVWVTSANGIYAKPLRPYLPVANRPALTQGLILSPNPTTGLLHIRSKGLVLGTLHIFDGTGREVLTAPSGSGILDVSVLRPGLYTLRAETPQGFVSERFLRQ